VARSRLLVIALITGAALFGVPIPTHAGPRFPDTVEREISLGRGTNLRASSVKGAAAEDDNRSLPIRANMAAVSFQTDDASRVEDLITVEARFHSRGEWTGWQSLAIEPEEGPDENSLEGLHQVDRVFTTPTWVGLADRMTVRLVAKAGAPAAWDVRGHLINTMGNAAKPTLLGRVSSAVSRFLHGSAAEAYVVQPTIIPRHSWGADESWREKGCCPRYARYVYMAFVHHTVGTNSYSRSESAAIVRGIYRYHTKTRHYSDIAYNFLVDRYGQIFEGRYGGIERPVIGAHVAGFNTGTTGVALMGTFTSASPTSAMVSSLYRLLAWKLDVHHIPAIGTVIMTSGGNPKWPAGKRVKFNRISGHSDGQQTSCPGSKAYHVLPTVRSAASHLGNPKIYLPGITTTTLRPNGDTANERATVRATLSQTASWVVDFLRHDGTLVRRITGTSSSVSATWDGKDSSGDLLETGYYKWVINARASGRNARAAQGALFLVNKHPDGTILKSATRSVYIDSGKARPIPTKLVADSWFRTNEVVATTDVEIDRYDNGTPMEIREGTLLTEPDGKHSIFFGGKRHEFADGVYEALGYTSASALTIGQDELDALQNGPVVSDTTIHPLGAVVKAPDASVWVIDDGQRHVANRSSAFLRSNYRMAEIANATPLDIGLPTGTPITYRGGTLFRTTDGNYWIFFEGKRRRFYNAGLYAAMGYRTDAVFAIGTSEAGAISQGPLII
jgi:N-acetylmuramoyl-L-alanine amidase-like protein